MWHRHYLETSVTKYFSEILLSDPSADSSDNALLMASVSALAPLG
ncbi:hypothetical protein RSal33209_0517 [Renibacterium salmoninarum ATCC 33209]|uniref:Uncharacterized protein n=1 Tax=Renibacterium salmoninarum (strain ATCC 33209 / DSM 20767 / JCM 11484 / NBRC 15589 / NCIMB 2235) TaxID=288705 RepID=A9WKZ8_RENSM|nr:hypothetical protein RSal33209_0517 [Renibacterium salmoninarum ATCC 33209]